MAGRTFTFGVRVTGDARGGVQAMQMTERELKDLRRELQRTDRGLKNSRRGFDRWARGMLSMRNAIGPLVGVAGAGMLARLGQQSISAASEVGKAADTAGVGAESLQELRFALGELANVSESQTDTALQRLNRRLGLAADGSGAAKDTFDELGIAMRDAGGRVRDTEVVLEEALRSLAEIDNNATRAAKASELFGEEMGPRIAASLSDGIQAMEDSRDRAHELNAVLGEDLVESAEKFDDWLRRLSIRLRGGFRRELLEAGAALERFFEIGEGEDLAFRIGRRLETLEEATMGRLELPARRVAELRQEIVWLAKDIDALDPSVVNVHPIQNQSTELPLPGLRFGFAEDTQRALDAAARRRQARRFVAENYGGSPGPNPLVDLPEVTMSMRELREAARSATEPVRELNNLGADLGMTFSSSLEDSLVSFDDWRDTVKSGLEDVARIIYRTFITAPLGRQAGNFVSGLFPSGGFEGVGNATPRAFADGGVIDRPTVALAGEAGPEAVFPLTRMGGKLGIQASGGAGDVHIHNEGQPMQVERFERRGPDLHVWVRNEMRRSLNQGELDREMAGNFGINRRGSR
ncbi:phage tail tape measure protein [Spiribacter halobius]|uniref:Phage tail tape measure protein domain-containing protein n=1 Tax=Sediminicurvatus halobius TaxID=2182432 RepID=A0A2U2MZB1_9GAMM|nr:phage tail tape measure protein [Spiribacter halobius]PWG62325.1 hypothetical protein DEM34_12690 [Spiribacter halobius]UEX79753.1 phage tail tape measure protein [Spiribacter halobius]